MSKGIVIPPMSHTHKGAQFAGGYVKDPQVGMHNWVMSFDLNSLYPHLIMQYNISPETFLEGEYQDISIEDIIDRKVEVPDDMCMAANGHYFSKEKQGFLPEMMELMYSERKGYKRKMLEAETELEEINKRLNAI
jgi:DNA polymerase elongation subunit (family B)